MNFIVGLPQTQNQHDYIWVVMICLTKSVDFIPIMSTYLVENYARIFKYDIVCLQGIPLSIISDRGAQFTSWFRRSFQKGLGTKVKLSTAFHT